MAIFGKLGRYTGTGLFIMRAGVGAMMIVHGLPNLTGGTKNWTDIGHAMGNLHIYFLPAMWGFISALTLTVGGLFCILGLWFRVVCLFMVFNFIVAATTHFTGIDGIAGAAHALELCFVFAGLLFLGPGRYSVDGA